MEGIITINSSSKLAQVIADIKRKNKLFFVIGGGTNLIANDSGFNGVVVKINNKNLNVSGDKIICGAGLALGDLINTANKKGLAGLETLAGIPGTVGGAIVGNAGAYGREISDSLSRVKIFDGEKLRWIPKKYCAFSYRNSVFKKQPSWIIFEAEFKLKKNNAAFLVNKSKEIIAIREKKYKPDIRCAGSIFKNILEDSSIGRKLKNKIPPDKIIVGKIPAGFLLEQVGAKGMRQGGIYVANHHGNLIINDGHGTARDAKALIEVLKSKIKNRYGIELEEEVQYLGF